MTDPTRRPSTAEDIRRYLRACGRPPQRSAEALVALATSPRAADRRWLHEIASSLCRATTITCVVCAREVRGEPIAFRCRACDRLMCLDCVTFDEAVSVVCRGCVTHHPDHEGD